MGFIGVNLTEEEKDTIKKAAVKKGLKIAPYIRCIALEHARKELIENVPV